MKTRVQRWGNSLALRIPKAFAEEIDLTSNTTVDVAIRGREIIISRAEEEELTLAKLVAGITHENRHPETDWGPAVGNEVW